MLFSSKNGVLIENRNFCNVSCSSGCFHFWKAESAHTHTERQRRCILGKVVREAPQGREGELRSVSGGEPCRRESGACVEVGASRVEAENKWGGCQRAGWRSWRLRPGTRLDMAYDSNVELTSLLV